ncbi:MAG: hypothetical protein D3904_16450, partial [Candidatus Electrothrix sp. EH2]|nr:hypothetical protein [Candidatus Electrothrix sp. EH2]
LFHVESIHREKIFLKLFVVNLARFVHRIGIGRILERQSDTVPLIDEPGCKLSLFSRDSGKQILCQLRLYTSLQLSRDLLLPSEAVAHHSQKKGDIDDKYPDEKERKIFFFPLLLASCQKLTGNKTERSSTKGN